MDKEMNYRGLAVIAASFMTTVMIFVNNPEMRWVMTWQSWTLLALGFGGSVHFIWSLHRFGKYLRQSEEGKGKDDG